MALSAGAHALYWRLTNVAATVRQESQGLAWAAFLTLLVAGPWLGAGYFFGTDFPGPRHFDWPSVVSSSLPLQAAMRVVSWLISAEATAKLFVLSILFVAALAAFTA